MNDDDDGGAIVVARCACTRVQSHTSPAVFNLQRKRANESMCGICFYCLKFISLRIAVSEMHAPTPKTTSQQPIQQSATANSLSKIFVISLVHIIFERTQ